MTDLAKIVDDLSKLTVLEAADLSKMLEEKWGVSAAAAVAVAAGPAGGGEDDRELGLLLGGRGGGTTTAGSRGDRHGGRGRHAPLLLEHLGEVGSFQNSQLGEIVYDFCQIGHDSTSFV